VAGLGDCLRRGEIESVALEDHNHFVAHYPDSEAGGAPVLGIFYKKAESAAIRRNRR
jgi:hypothetical protein